MRTADGRLILDKELNAARSIDISLTYYVMGDAGSRNAIKYIFQTYFHE